MSFFLVSQTCHVFFYSLGVLAFYLSLCLKHCFPLSSPNSYFLRTHLWRFFFQKNLPCHHETGSRVHPWTMAPTILPLNCILFSPSAGPRAGRDWLKHGDCCVGCCSSRLARFWTTAMMGADRSTRLERDLSSTESVFVFIPHLYWKPPCNRCLNTFQRMNKLMKTWFRHTK